MPFGFGSVAQQRPCIRKKAQANRDITLCQVILLNPQHNHHAVRSALLGANVFTQPGSGVSICRTKKLPLKANPR